MTHAAQFAGQALLRCWPPPSTTAKNDNGIRFQNGSQGLCRVAAQINADGHGDRTLTRNDVKPPLIEFNQHRRSFKGKRIRNNLRNNKSNAAVQSACKSTRFFQSRESGLQRCEHYIEI